MAERRMFAERVVCSDKFLELSNDAKLLYFYLGVVAKDKGVVINAKSWAFLLTNSDDAIQELITNKYLIAIENGNYQIVHWYENNGVGETAKARNNYSYRKWRESVISRDGKCVECGRTDNLVAHHIKSFAEYPELRLDLNNGVTLCQLCHAKLHGLEKKDG